VTYNNRSLTAPPSLRRFELDSAGTRDVSVAWKF